MPRKRRPQETSITTAWEKINRGLQELIAAREAELAPKPLTPQEVSKLMRPPRATYH